MFISFLYPFPIRNLESPFLWVYYKQLKTMTIEDIVFIGSKEYFFNPSYFKGKNRWELTSDSCKYNSYEIPSIEKINSYDNFIFNNDIFHDLIKQFSNSLDLTWSYLLNNRYINLENELITILDKITNKYKKIDAILSWCNCPSLEHVAKKFNIRIIYNEIGPLRPPLYNYTAYFDFSGVNGRTESKKRYEKFLTELDTNNITLPLFSREELLNIVSNNIQHLNNIEQPFYKAGIALQVENDSNMLAYSNGFDNFKLISLVKQYYNCQDISVRKHPGGYLDYSKTNCVPDNSDSSINFLKKCNEVFSINSSVILESLLLGKKTHILGDSPFSFLEQLKGYELDKGLSFILFGYLIPLEKLFDKKYYKWRLSTNVGEIDIFMDNLKFYLQENIKKRDLLEITLNNVTEQKNIIQKNLDNLSTQYNNLNIQHNNLYEQFNNLNTQYATVQENLNELTTQYNNLKKQLYIIETSRGYKFLYFYYKIRDKLFPTNSKRKLLLKAIIKLKKIRPFINKENLKRTYYLYKKSGFKQLLIKIDDKLNRVTTVTKINSETNEPIYLNNLLTKNTITVPDTVIVDVIIPIYNAYDYTKRCISSVYKNTDISYNLYLVNDCSPDTRIHELLVELSNKTTPTNLKNLYIVENDVNLGFIKSVNKAISLSKNHIVLLNTDTEVPSNWLSRLISPMINDNKIASITPFSNCATICSFPNFCKDNLLPEHITLENLDDIFAQYGGNNLIDIPTGVGFCMAMNRDCLSNFDGLDTIYGKGYCEENDWCRRVAKQGYRNIMITNLFVYHKHGVSFGEQMDKSKIERIEENLQILNKRYPDYSSLVNDFISKDPIKDTREFLNCICQNKKNNHLEGIMFVIHSCVGGTAFYQESLINKWKSTKRIFVIELLADLKSLHFIVYQEAKQKDFYFNFNEMSSDEFTNLTKAFNINHIYINQLVTYPLEKIIQFISTTNIKYTFFIHDYYAVCPEYDLLNKNKKYCNAEKNPDICNECLKKQHHNISVDIKNWRSLFYSFLSNAENVFAPSQTTTDIVNSYYPNLKIQVKEHSLPEYLKMTFNKNFLNEKPINISIIGAIGENKGSQIIYELTKKIKKNKLPINIKVIGITNLHNNYYKSEDGILEITGRYDNTQISQLLAKYKTSFVLIPSIWAETYSYTASEAVFSGYPIMVFNMGAPAERVRRWDCGWILNTCKAEVLLDKIKYLISNTDEIYNKHINITTLLNKK